MLIWKVSVPSLSPSYGRITLMQLKVKKEQDMKQDTGIVAKIDNEQDFEEETIE